MDDALFSLINLSQMQIDACQLAMGVYFRGDWFYHYFPVDSPTLTSLHIYNKEVLAQILAAFRWANYQHVILH